MDIMTQLELYFEKVLLTIILDNTDKWSAIKYTVINNSSIRFFTFTLYR